MCNKIRFNICKKAISLDLKNSLQTNNHYYYEKKHFYVFNYVFNSVM